MLARSGLTSDGRRFLEKALHPVADVKSPGIPDMNEVDLYRTEFRTTTSIVSPLYTNFDSDTWDCLVWCPPGDNTAAIVAIGAKGVDFNTASLADQTGVSNIDTVIAYQIPFNTNLPGDIFRGVADNMSWWVEPGDPAEDAATQPYSRFFGTTWGKLMPRRWRTTASSVTMNLIANATQDQGSIYVWEGGRAFADGIAMEHWTTEVANIGAAQPTLGYATGTFTPATGKITAVGYWLREPGQAPLPAQFPAGPPFTADPEDIGAVFEVSQLRVTSVPFDEESMFAQSSHLYATEARHGCYCVHRFLGPDQPLQNTNDLPHLLITPLWAYTKSGDPRKAARFIPASWSLAPYLADVRGTAVDVQPSASMCVTPTNACGPPAKLYGAAGVAVTGASVPPWLSSLCNSPLSRDTSLDNVSQSVTVFRGLDKSASIQFKRLLSLEAAPLEDSPARPFVSPPCAVDLAAIRLYYEIAHRLDAVHPASANDFGDILKSIASVIGKILPIAGSIATVIAPEFAPAIGGAVALGELGVAATRGAVNALRKRPKPKAKQSRPARRK